MKKPTIIKMTAKCSDACNILLSDNENNILQEYNGYVPDFFPGDHFGDYIEFDIEIATGKILNWKVPTKSELDNLTDR